MKEQTPDRNDRNEGRETIRRTQTLERHATIPIELDFPEDCTVSDHDPLIDETPSHAYGPPTRDDGELRRFADSLPKEARNILAGGIAGIVAKTVVAPVDRIKIMYQISAATFRLQDVPKVAWKIVQTEGWAALWKGNTAAMIRVFPYSGIQFMVYDFCKQFFVDRRRSLDSASSSPLKSDDSERQLMQSSLLPLESLISGMTAGSVSVLCTYPLDLTRAQLAVVKRTQERSSHSFLGMLRENMRQRGVVGLFRGITPTMLGIFPYSGMAFALNEQGKRQIHHLFGREVTTIERMQCGAFAGLIAQTVTYPIEVTRRRMQTVGLVGIRNDSALTSLGCSSKRPTTPPTLFATVADLYKEQGMNGFLKGVTMNWIKGPIAFSISFTMYDTAQKFLETTTEREQRMH